MREREGLVREGLVREREGLVREREGLVRERKGLVREREGLVRERVQVWHNTDWFYAVQCVYVTYNICRSYVSNGSHLAALDSEYITAVPELYSNPPRQFHVQVACRQAQNRAYLCTGPATLIFRVSGSVWVCGCG